MDFENNDMEGLDEELDNIIILMMRMETKYNSNF